MPGRRRDRAGHVAIERRRVVDDRHARARRGRTTAARPAGTRSSPTTSRASDTLVAVPLGACGIPRSHSSCANRSRSSARSIESGDVPMMRIPALCSRSESLSGVCPPYCTTHDTSPPRLLLARDDRRDVLERQRLEVEAVDGVVVGRNGLGVAVDHDRFVAFVAQRERRVTAAVVELEPLPDAVRPAAEDDDLPPRRRIGLALLLVGAVQVGRERLELRRAGIDALVRGDEPVLGAQRRESLRRLCRGSSRDPGR